MAVQDLDLRDVQGMHFNVTSDGVRANFGRALRRLILKNPSGAKKVYFSMGSAGLLSSLAPSVASSLASIYPYLEAGEAFTLENFIVPPTEVEMKTAYGESVTNFRMILL